MYVHIQGYSRRPWPSLLYIYLSIYLSIYIYEDTGGDLGLLAIDFKDGNVAIAVDFVARRMPHRVARTVPVHLRLGLRRDEYV